MVMLDIDFDSKSQVFDLDAVFYADDIAAKNWEVHFPASRLGERLMGVFIDIYGNEARVVIERNEFRPSPKTPRSKHARQRAMTGGSRAMRSSRK